MSNEKFTPGPLFIETVHVGDEKWDEIRDKDGNFISESGNYWDTDPEPNPDSILQQYAPEMYDALKDAWQTFHSMALDLEDSGAWDDAERWHQKADAIDKLLKKARGEE